MEKRGVDQSTLARDLGVTQGAISKIILGKTANSRLIPRIATHLGVSMPWLLGDSDHDHGDEPEDAPLDHETRDMVRNFQHLAPADRRALLQIARSMAGGAPPSETVHARGGEGKAATVHDKALPFRAEIEE